MHIYINQLGYCWFYGLGNGLLLVCHKYITFTYAGLLSIAPLYATSESVSKHEKVWHGFERVFYKIMAIEVSLEWLKITVFMD